MAEEAEGPASEPPTGPSTAPGPAAPGPAAPGPAGRPAPAKPIWAAEEQAWLLDEQVWGSDPAGWPADSAAWPDGEEAWPEEDWEPPVPEEILLAMDPDVGPPGPGDDWPADDEAADLADDRIPGALPAGFTHRDAARRGPEYAVGSRSGFAGGGPADTLEPGPVLAGLTSHAWDDGLPALGDDELIGVLCAARRVCSWQAALELAAVAELDARRTAQAQAHAAQAAARADAGRADAGRADAARADAGRADAGRADAGRADAGRADAALLDPHTSEELSAALVLTRRAADTLIAVAAGLARLPAVAAALASGIIDQARAAIFADELVALGDADAVTIAAGVLPRAGDLTTGQLRAALRRAVLAFDPAAARRRRERAAAEARVETWAESSGNSAMAGRELSPAEAIAAERHLDAVAHGLKAAGAPGTLDQLRKGAFAALLSGQSPESLLPPGTGRADRAGGGGGPAGSPGSGIAWPPGPLGTIHLTLPLMAWLGLSDTPGTVAGLGPTDAATCRDLARIMSGWRGTRWCLTITTPDGRALGHACTRTGPPGTGPPDRNPPRTGPPGTGPPDKNPPRTGPPGTGPPDKNPPRTGPPGTGPPGTGPPGTGPPVGDSPRAGPPGTGSPDAARWLAGLKIHWLETGACGHARETACYRPSALLRHLVKTRNPTCTYPGCRRSADACDDDHTVAYDRGGRTCECNLAPLCRRHHRTKQALGWHLEQPRPGVLVWITPHGRRYLASVEPYPV